MRRRQRPPSRSQTVALARAWRALALGDATFLSWILLLALGTGFLLTMAGSPHTSSTKTASTATATPAPRASVPPSNATAAVRAAQAKVYPMPDADAGLMQPAVDQQGNIWVGEMTLNKLARLDPSTGKLTEWTPPNGNYNIMATAVDASGNIWFTEQASNYIGRFDPKTETFKTYPLAQTNGHNAGPQDLQFDSTGNLWFTELTGGRIGRLDPATGDIRDWTIPAPRSGVQSYPYSLAVTPGGQIWFGYLTGGAVGRLDPSQRQGHDQQAGKCERRRLRDGVRRQRTRLVHRDAARAPWPHRHEHWLRQREGSTIQARRPSNALRAESREEWRRVVRQRGCQRDCALSALGQQLPLLPTSHTTEHPLRPRH